MADGRKNNKPVNGFKPNTSGNPKGSDKKVRVIKSKLTPLFESLLEMQERAVKLLDESLDGKQVNPEALGTSKWICSSIVTLQKAILSEEVAKTKLKIELLEVNSTDEQTPQEIEKELKPRLSLVYKDPNSEDEE